MREITFSKASLREPRFHKCLLHMSHEFMPPPMMASFADAIAAVACFRAAAPSRQLQLPGAGDGDDGLSSPCFASDAHITYFVIITRPIQLLLRTYMAPRLASAAKYRSATLTDRPRWAPHTPASVSHIRQYVRRAMPPGRVSSHDLSIRN